MTAVISKELRDEVLETARQKQPSTLAGTAAMYMNKMTRAISRGAYKEIPDPEQAARTFMRKAWDLVGLAKTGDPFTRPEVTAAQNHPAFQKALREYSSAYTRYRAPN
jgi:proteasome lid subunit RPN8/RPN11